MSTVKATNFQNASSSTVNMVTDASGNVSFGGTAAMSSSFLRNRIINGDMRVDQRNAGASITPGNGAYLVDRWQYSSTQASKFTAQQNAGSVTPPTGYSNYLGMTVATAVTVAAGDYFFIGQAIEGFNFADMAWGTANAKTITLSFQVYSSLTGTFGGALLNSAQNRSYPFTYTISSANTWTSISITIAGDTTGTWIGSTNGTGLKIWFGLGVGSTNSGTAGAWAGTQYISATGATSVVGTNGATWYVTGVQLEVGTVATPFERQIYSNQLAQCQRYYYRATTAGSSRVIGNGFVTSTTIADFITPYPVTMRDEPSALEQTGTAANYQVLTGGGGVNCSAVPTYLTSTQWGAQFRLTVASGLTTGQSVIGRIAVTGGYLGWSAEL